MNQRDNRISQKDQLGLLAGYGLAVGATALSALARWLLPLALTPAPYLGFYPAVVVSAALGGVGPGLVSTFASLFLVNFVFGRFNVHDSGAMMCQVIWVVASIGVSLLAGMQRTARIREQQRAEELRESEARYRSLFEHMLDGFAYCQMLFDEDGQPEDFVYLAVNNSFGKLTGLAEVIGKRVTQVIPRIKELNPELFELYGRVARTGNPERFDIDLKSPSLYLSISVYSPQKGYFVAIFDNITERKRAEESLARAHEQTDANRRRLETILETAPVGVVLIDSNNRFSLINRRAAEIYGTDYDGFDLQDHIARVKLLQPDGTPFPVDDLPVSRAWRGEESHNVEMTIERANGVRLPLVVNTAPLRDAEGNVTTAVVVFDDISDRKAAEQAVRESEEQFRTLAESIPNLAWWANADGYITWYNQRWYDYTGTTPEQMEGWGWQSVHDPEVLPQVVEQWKESLATGKTFDMVFPLHGADGIFRPFLTRVIPVFDQDGRIVRWFGTNTDISEQKRAEEALRESEEKLSMALRAADMGVWRLDLNERKRHFDDQVCRCLGIDPARFDGTADAFYATVHPDDRETITAALGETIKNGAPYEAEYRVVWPNGRIRFICSRGRLARDAAGQAQWVHGLVWDITERKEAEEALQKAHSELALQMVERTRELHEKEVLLKEVHHRVKNNLQVISSLVGMQAEGTQDETVREVLQDVTYRVRSMALVHEKLYQSESLARVDFAEYARSLLHYLWRVHGAAAEAIGLVLDLEPVSLPVDIAVPCGLILNELAGNALKHAFRGRDEGKVTVSLRGAEGGSIALSVSDNGAGLPAGYDWRKSGSMGLRLVHMLTGQLRAEVVVGSTEGMKFTVTFRLKADEKRELLSA